MPKYNKNCLKCGDHLAVPSWKYCQNCASWKRKKYFSKKTINGLTSKIYIPEIISDSYSFNWDYKPKIKWLKTSYLNLPDVDIVVVDEADKIIGYRFSQSNPSI